MTLLLSYLTFHLVCAMFSVLLYFVSSRLLHANDYRDFKGSLIIALVGGPITLTIFIIGVILQ